MAKTEWMGDPAGAAMPAAAPTLFGHLRQRPGLLLIEIAWRWGTGGLLLLLGGFEAWRIWVAALPELHRIGVLQLSATLFLEDPSQALRMLSESVALLEGPIDRAVWGLGPLAVFVWVAAYAAGRSAVLARFDPQLPRRPWLLAESEALRVVGRLLAAALWGAVAEAACGRIAHDQPAWFPVLLLGGLSVGLLLLSAPAVRTSQFATLLALVEGRSLGSVWRRAWVYEHSDVVKPLREAVKRVRRLLLLLALVLALVPDPFPFGPRLMLWWVLLGLPSLVMADAWKLGGVLAVLGTLEAVEPRQVPGPASLAGPAGNRPANLGPGGAGEAGEASEAGGRARREVGDQGVGDQEVGDRGVEDRGVEAGMPDGERGWRPGRPGAGRARVRP